MEPTDSSDQTPSKREFANRILEGLVNAGELRSVRFREETFSLVYEDDSSGEINLKNMYAEHCATEPTSRNNHLRRVLLALMQANFELPEEFEDARPDLRPKIWTRVTFAQMKLASEIKGQQSLDLPLVPIGEHLLLGLVFDLPASMRSITADNLRDWDVTIYEGIEASKQNLLEAGFPLALLGESVYVSVAGDHYDCCRVLATDLIRSLKMKGEPIAMIPNRDSLFITGSDDVEGLDMIATLTEKVMEEPRPMLSLALRLIDDEWVDWIPEEDHPAFPRFMDLRIQCMLGIYDVQREQLMQLHSAQGRDIFVASLIAVRGKEDGRIWTSCVWAAGVETLLPEADYVIFYNNDSRQQIRVAWKHALEIVDSLMEEVEDLYPRRYRVDAFPNDAQLSELKAVAVD